MLRARPDIVHSLPPHVTPFAAPLMLEAGRIPIRGAGSERLLDAEAARMMAEAGLQMEDAHATTGA
jgi:ATP-dependent Lhr-like helicase